MATSDSDRSAALGNLSPFLTTHWSLVLAAGRNDTPESAAALEKLCRTYWLPLYAYVRHRVPDVHQAQDLTQAFFERVLEKNYLAEADPQRGRFRAFLLTAFKHFLSKEWEKAKAQKRGGGKRLFQLDFVADDSLVAIKPAGGMTPEQLYERQWAMTLLNKVMQRLERELANAGKRLEFERLKDFIIGRSERAGSAELAVELGMTASAVRMAASRLRKRYRELLRDEISHTVVSADDVDDEIRHLFALFSR